MPSQIDFAALINLFPSDSIYVTSSGWVAIASTVLLGFGKEPLVADLIAEALSQTAGDDQKQATAMRKVREAMLKASPLVGFPRVCCAAPPQHAAAV